MNKIMGTIGVALGLTIVLGAILSLPIMWLWNACLVPAVTGVNEIGWLQAWGLTVLCTALFKTSATKGS